MTSRLLCGARVTPTAGAGVVVLRAGGVTRGASCAVATPAAAGMPSSSFTFASRRDVNTNNGYRTTRSDLHGAENVSRLWRHRRGRSRGVVVLPAAASSSESGGGDLEPEAREYKGELRMPVNVPDKPVELPAMLFPSEEMLLPGCTQVLHLYEARFLALLDEVSAATGGLFAHVTFLPPSEDSVDDGGLRVNQVATLVRVEEIQREEVGAKVTIIGESRCTLLDIKESQPYITAVFVPVPVMGAGGTLAYTPSDDEMAEVEALTEFIDTAVNDIVMLVDRLLEGEEGRISWDTAEATAEAGAVHV